MGRYSKWALTRASRMPRNMRSKVRLSVAKRWMKSEASSKKADWSSGEEKPMRERPGQRLVATARKSKGPGRTALECKVTALGRLGRHPGDEVEVVCGQGAEVLLVLALWRRRRCSQSQQAAWAGIRDGRAGATHTLVLGEADAAAADLEVALGPLPLAGRVNLNPADDVRALVGDRLQTARADGMR
jgi:hypothetical protein